jgi:Phage baseplate assembly protein W
LALGKTYGIDFPFADSPKGDYLLMTETPEKEIRANLIHLLLTRKGSRYYLPDFGTRLYEYLFEPLDGPSFDNIRSEIRESVEKFIPNLRIDNITIKPLSEDEGSTNRGEVIQDERTYNMFDIFRTAGEGVEEYTAKVLIEFSITDDAFESKDFIILNI